MFLQHSCVPSSRKVCSYRPEDNNPIAMEVQDESCPEESTIEKNLRQDFGKDGKLNTDPHVSLCRISIPPDFVDETRKIGTREAVCTRVGQEIQLPKKHAEDFKI